jgi:hypothetical protein
MKTKLALMALALLLWCASPAQAQMSARCYLFPSGPNMQVEATATEQDFEIMVRGNRCLIFVIVDSPMFPGKRSAWLIEGKTGDLLAEFYAPTNHGRPWELTDRGLCQFRGGRFKTTQCAWAEWKVLADQM